MSDKAIINLNENKYELKFNLKALENIERAIGSSLMGELSKYNAMLPLTTLRVLFSHSLYQIDAGKIAIEQASDLFDKLINEKGFIFVNMLVVNEIKIDCPFFFQGV